MLSFSLEPSFMARLCGHYIALSIDRRLRFWREARVTGLVRPCDLSGGILEWSRRWKMEDALMRKAA